MSSFNIPFLCSVFLFFDLHMFRSWRDLKNPFKFMTVLCTTKTAAQKSDLCNSKLSTVSKSVVSWSDLKVEFETFKLITQVTDGNYYQKNRLKQKRAIC